MSRLIEILGPDFLLHHAVYASLIVGLICPLVGAYLVLRRLVFWGVALPQVSAAGIAFSFLLQGLGLSVLGGPGHEKHLAIAGSIVFTAAAILALVILERGRSGSQEGRVGALYAAASAASILFVAWNAAGETEMLGLLKGELVSISEADFHLILDAFLVVLACLVLFQREFLLVSFDRDFAVSLGRRATAWDAFLYLLIGLTVSLGVMTVGPLVVFGLLVLPPMAALPWARSLASLSLLASAIGGLSALGGFYVSYAYDLPLGPVIVAAACLSLLASQGGRALARR